MGEITGSTSGTPIPTTPPPGSGPTINELQFGHVASRLDAMLVAINGDDTVTPSIPKSITVENFDSAQQLLEQWKGELEKKKDILLPNIKNKGHLQALTESLDNLLKTNDFNSFKTSLNTCKGDLESSFWENFGKPIGPATRYDELGWNYWLKKLEEFRTTPTPKLPPEKLPPGLGVCQWNNCATSSICRSNPTNSNATHSTS